MNKFTIKKRSFGRPNTQHSASTFAHRLKRTNERNDISLYRLTERSYSYNENRTRIERHTICGSTNILHMHKNNNNKKTMKRKKKKTFLPHSKSNEMRKFNMDVHRNNNKHIKFVFFLCSFWCWCAQNGVNKLGILLIKILNEIEWNFHIFRWTERYGWADASQWWLANVSLMVGNGNERKKHQNGQAKRMNRMEYE